MAAWMARLANRTAVAGMQPFWRRLHAASLLGMNIGGSIDPLENGEAWLVDELVPKAGLVLDVGANVGRYALMVRSVRPSAVLHCFEPGSAAFSELESLGGPDLFTWNLAVADAPGRGVLHLADSNSELSSLVDLGRGSASEAVEIITIDGFLRQEGISRVDLLKVDAEGGDLEVLRGARQSLASGAIRAVQFEFGGTAIGSRDYLSDFADALSGYSLHRLLRNGMAPVIPTEAEEIFVMANYVALWAGDSLPAG
jgi:FkbM family methyltransferase